MPWLVTVPLLGFFYLPQRATRITVSALIVANLALFYVVYSTFGFAKTVDGWKFLEPVWLILKFIVMLIMMPMIFPVLLSEWESNVLQC